MRSPLLQSVNAQKLLDGVHEGDLKIVSHGVRGNPVVDFKQSIGIDSGSGKITQFGQIYSGENGAHIVPYNPDLIK